MVTNPAQSSPPETSEPKMTWRGKELWYQIRAMCAQLGQLGSVRVEDVDMLTMWVGWGGPVKGS